MPTLYWTVNETGNRNRVLERCKIRFWLVHWIDPRSIEHNYACFEDMMHYHGNYDLWHGFIYGRVYDTVNHMHIFHWEINSVFVQVAFCCTVSPGLARSPKINFWDNCSRFITGQMSLLLPKQQCKSIEGNSNHWHSSNCQQVIIIHWHLLNQSINSTEWLPRTWMLHPLHWLSRANTDWQKYKFY